MHGYIDMLVAHALQNGLAGGVFVVPGERHIFFAQAGQGRRNFSGSWVRVAAEPVKAKDADVWVFTIPTLSKDEWNQYLDPQRYAAKKCPAFRRTFNIRW